MTALRNSLICAFLVALTILVGLSAWAVWSISQTISRLPDLVDRRVAIEMSITRSMLSGQLDEAREDLAQQMDLIRQAARQEIAATRKDLMGQLDELQWRMDARLAAMQDDLKQEIHPVSSAAVDLLGTYQGIPASVAENTKWLWDCKRYPACLQSQMLAVTGSVKAAAGELAKTAPQLSASMRRIAENSERTTNESAAFMRNLSKSFRPLPRWLQVPLAIAVPAAQISTPFVLGRIGISSMVSKPAELAPAQ